MGVLADTKPERTWLKQLSALDIASTNVPSIAALIMISLPRCGRFLHGVSPFCRPAPQLETILLYSCESVEVTRSPWANARTLENEVSRRRRASEPRRFRSYFHFHFLASAAAVCGPNDCSHLAFPMD